MEAEYMLGKSKPVGKMPLHKLLLIRGLMVSLALLATPLTGQTFTTLYNVGGALPDGANPLGGLVLSGNTLYGTAEWGGGFNYGTVFKLNTDGTGFEVLHTFTDGVYVSNPTPPDGGMPQGGLILYNNTLYGTTWTFLNGHGSVFQVNTDGLEYKLLVAYSSDPGLGAYPTDGVVLLSNTLYGTTRGGGNSDSGTIFSIGTDGTGFTVLHRFTAPTGPYPQTNSDGSSPNGLIVVSNELYGTTYSGGALGVGILYSMSTDGTGFTNLHTFTGGNDGASSFSQLLMSGNNLYGTTAGYSSNVGTIFSIKTDGTGLRTLHRFNDFSGGASPRGGLVQIGNTLFGTTERGGSSSNGIVYCINTDGTGYTILHHFSDRSNPTSGPGVNSDGAYPECGLTSSANSLYGTTHDGGSLGFGTLFKLSLSQFFPRLAIALSGGSAVLTWPTNGYHYALESATNLLPGATWTHVSPPPVIVNGQNSVTNLVSGTQKFYRLRQ